MGGLDRGAAMTGQSLAPALCLYRPTLGLSPDCCLSGRDHRRLLVGLAAVGPLVRVIPFTLLWESISSQFPLQT